MMMLADSSFLKIGLFVKEVVVVDSQEGLIRQEGKCLPPRSEPDGWSEL